jgi:hypothetical protein
MDYRCQTINDPEIILPGLVVKDLHSKEATDRSTENSQKQQNLFWYAPTITFGLKLVIAKQ